jgi:hypothetical protein
MENEELSSQEAGMRGRWLWFVGGCALSITTLTSIVLLVLLILSLSINAYLAWIMSGYQVSVSRAVPISTVVIGISPSQELAQAPPTSLASETPVTTPVTIGTPMPLNTPAPPGTPIALGTPMALETPTTLQAEFATLAAIATEVAQEKAAGAPAATPSPAPSSSSELLAGPVTPEAAVEPAATSTPMSQVGEVASAKPEDTESGPELATSGGTSIQPAASSTNVYTLIPIEGGRESRPADEHGDLNLKLRDPQPADYPAELIDIPGSGIDPNAPKLSSVFKPDFVGTYAIHDWDWNCNCKGALIQDGKSVLVGIRTTPGQPIFIPKTDRDIYEGKYYAVVLYASEDQLTIQYARRGNVAEGYTIHLLGLQTDPNLVKLFQESKGDQLPGLTLDTPVGIAGDQVIVAIRDNGTFFDARSRQDWWE